MILEKIKEIFHSIFSSENSSERREYRNQREGLTEEEINQIFEEQRGIPRGIYKSSIINEKERFIFVEGTAIYKGKTFVIFRPTKTTNPTSYQIMGKENFLSGDQNLLYVVQRKNTVF